MPIDIDTLIAKMEWAAQRGMSTVALKTSGTRINIRRLGVASSTPVALSGEPLSKELAASVQDDDANTVLAPMTGICYLKPESNETAFISVGDTVIEGQTICIIEAMKVMTSVPSIASGTVEAILVEDGASVDAGTALIMVRP